MFPEWWLGQQARALAHRPAYKLSWRIPFVLFPALQYTDLYSSSHRDIAMLMRRAGLLQAHHVHDEATAASFFVQGGGVVCFDASVVLRRDLIVALLSLRICRESTRVTPARHGFVELAVFLLSNEVAPFFPFLQHSL